MIFLSVWLLIALPSCFVTSADVETEDGVLVLNKSNFNSSVTDNDFILVEFYAPWCGHCKALAPEYAKAAKALEEAGSNIKLAKVDATVETDLAELHGVRGYPTLKFFKRGSPTEYSGGRTADEIVNWVKKKTGPPALNIESVDDAKAFIDGNSVAVLGFFKDQTSENALTYLKTAEQLDRYVFGITSADAVFSEYSVDGDKVVLFKKFDEEREDFAGELSEINLKKFVFTGSLPLVVEFNHETAQTIFGGDIKSHLLLFSPKDGSSSDLIEPLKKVAKEYRDQVLFVSINSEDNDHQRILEFFGVKKTDIPSMRLIKLEEEMVKYKPDNEKIDPENVKKFVEDFLQGKLKQHLLSQDLPDDWNKTPVKTLVASNFDSVVFDSTKDVLVEFYAPWCVHCKQLAPIYEQVGEHFKDSDTVVIAKMDATSNELEHTKIVNYPTLKLYKSGDNKVIEYGGERTLEGLIKFVQAGGEIGQSVPEEAEDENEDDDLPPKDEL